MNHARKLFAVVALVLLGTACTSDSWDQALADEFNLEAQQCVEDRGFEYPETGYLETEMLLSDDPGVAAFDECWAELAVTERFAQLGLQAPSEFLAQTTSDQYAWWKCVEEGGYVRITPIPLNAAGGYPLEPTAANFGIAEDADAVAAFYTTVSECGDVEIEAFQEPDGSFWYGESIGECVEHSHEDASSHSHDCHFAHSYPGES